MKMFYGNTPVNSLKVKHYEISTNDATLIPSDLQAGITAYAKGQKVTGTGKSFEFAYYGYIDTNRMQYIPNNINIIEIASVSHPVQLYIPLINMKSVDFTTAQVVGCVIVDGESYEITVQALNNFLTVSCEKTVSLQIFYGKDNYI